MSAEMCIIFLPVGFKYGCVPNINVADNNTNNNNNRGLDCIALSYTGCPKKNATPIFPYISVRFNGTGQCFIWAVRGCPTVRFAYRQWSEQQAVLEIFSFRFGLSYHTRNNFESIQSIYWRIYKDGEQR